LVKKSTTQNQGPPKNGQATDTNGTKVAVGK